MIEHPTDETFFDPLVGHGENAPFGYAEELTPEGLQLVIPGCEKIIPARKDGKAAQLSLF
jgi:hypothetical protein